MPNWAEGTMKVRGAREDVLRFLQEGLKIVNWLTGDEIAPVQIIKDECGDYEMRVPDEYRKELIWVEGTRRAFIELPTDTIYDFEYDVPVVELKVQQAWAVIAENFVEISEKYNIDIHIFAWERGMQFAQEVEVLKGEVTKDIEIKYDDYMWDAPFKGFGG